MSHKDFSVFSQIMFHKFGNVHACRYLAYSLYHLQAVGILKL